MLESIDTARTPRDLGTVGLLDGSDTGQGPEVTVRNPREFLVDLFHVVAGNVLHGETKHERQRQRV